MSLSEDIRGLRARTLAGLDAAHDYHSFTNNAWEIVRRVANPIYGSKAGRLARYRAGDKVEIPEPYHLQTWQLLHKLVGDIADAAIARLP